MKAKVDMNIKREFSTRDNKYILTFLIYLFPEEESIEENVFYISFFEKDVLEMEDLSKAFRDLADKIEKYGG